MQLLMAKILQQLHFSLLEFLSLNPIPSFSVLLKSLKNKKATKEHGTMYKKIGVCEEAGDAMHMISLVQTFKLLHSYTSYYDNRYCSTTNYMHCYLYSIPNFLWMPALLHPLTYPTAFFTIFFLPVT